MKNASIHGLRGLACLMVIVVHLYGMAHFGGFFPPFNMHESFGSYIPISALLGSIFFSSLVGI